MNPFYLLVPVGLILLVCLIFRGRNDKLPRFKGRENLPSTTIYARFFETSGLAQETFTDIWQELADTLEIPAGLLRPEDRFDKELAPQKGNEWDDPLAVLPNVIKRRYKRAGMPMPDLRNIRTIRDFIEVASKPDVECQPRSS